MCDDAQVLRKDYGEYREAMRQMVNEVDPIGLIAGGPPTTSTTFGMPISDEAATRIAEGITRIREEFGYTEE